MAYPQNDPKKPVPAAASVPEIEQRVLDHWSSDATFKASIDTRPVHGHTLSNEVEPVPPAKRVY